MTNVTAEAQSTPLLVGEPFTTAWDEYEELLVQGRKIFLLGAGCSCCAGLPLMTDLTTKCLDSAQLSSVSAVILKKIVSFFARDSQAGASLVPTANIEDYLSELVDSLAIAARRASKGAPTSDISIGDARYSPEQLMLSVEEIKRAIAGIIDIPCPLDVHRKFVKAVHRPVRPGKSGTPPVVDYMMLNYDTLIEYALASEKLAYADGMNGGAVAWWDPNAFERDHIAARVFKLHGSIDWYSGADEPMPCRSARTIPASTQVPRSVMIWPASTKYRETQRDPFAQLMDAARRSLRLTGGAQAVLTVCGYSFGDEHVNTEIVRALKESLGRLTVAVFCYEEEPAGFLKVIHEDPEILSQIRIYSRRGFFHGSTVERSTTDCEWSTFKGLARLLSGER